MTSTPIATLEQQRLICSYESFFAARKSRQQEDTTSREKWFEFGFVLRTSCLVTEAPPTFFFPREALRLPPSLLLFGAVSANLLWRFVLAVFNMECITMLREVANELVQHGTRENIQGARG